MRWLAYSPAPDITNDRSIQVWFKSFPFGSDQNVGLNKKPLLFSPKGLVILLVTDPSDNMADKSREIVGVQVIHDQGVPSLGQVKLVIE